MTESDLVKVAYDAAADQYARLFPDARFEAEDDIRIIDSFVTSLGKDSERRVLDAGCGTGRMIAYLRSIDPTLAVTAVDISPAMVAFAREANPQATVLEGDLNSLPFDDQQFDGLFSWYSIIHTPPSELFHLAQEFHRVLRPGGIALLGFQAGRGARSLRHAYGTNITLRAYLHQPGDVEADLARSGLNARHTLVRRPRHNETHFQATVVAARPGTPALRRVRPPTKKTFGVKTDNGLHQ